MSYPPILYAIEIHDPEKIEAAFKAGLSPNDSIEGRPLFLTMVEMYLRSPKFAACMRVFIDYGLNIDEPELVWVLSDQPEKLRRVIEAEPALVNKTYHQFNSPFTPLRGATLLHFCAEFNHTQCAKVLIDAGADMEARAGLDSDGLGGQTPLFHTVNQHKDNSSAMRNLLLSKGADPLHFIKGLKWGEGCEWETFLPSLNAISYAAFGNLPQMQREEKDIAASIHELMLRAYGKSPANENVPNKYLRG